MMESLTLTCKAVSELLPSLLLVVMVISLPGVSIQQGSEADLLDTKGKVILQPDRVFNITFLKAIGVIVKNLNAVYIQLWRRNSSNNFTLDWQIKLTSLPVFGLNTIALEEADWIEILPEHRLGIYNERDPGPILYSVTEYGTSIFSSRTFPRTDPPAPGQTHLFNELKFPFAFNVILCNFTECLPSEPTTTTTVSTSTVTSTVKTTRAAQSPVVNGGLVAGGTIHPLMNGTFLTVLLVWLIIVSFIVITVVIVVIYLNARDSGAITKAAEDKSSTIDPEGDWYIVVQDTTQAQKVMTT